jgi:hypothetical protein
MTDRAPQLHHLSVHPDVHLTQMPIPVAESRMRLDPLTANVRREQRAKPVPPEPHRLAAQINAALERQVLNVPQALVRRQKWHHLTVLHPTVPVPAHFPKVFVAQFAHPDLTFLVHSPPVLHHFTIELNVHLIEVLPPMPKAAHPVHSLAANTSGEHRSEPVTPQPNRLMADVDAPLKQEVVHVPQAQRKTDVHHHHQPDHLLRRVEVPKRIGGFAGPGHSENLPPVPLAG